ncbi:ABC transporter ATP-binding protein [Paenibacillus alginolyticus]|uniref:ABC transporter ATP-binding protein n=1 Tax=Paenibacillus alginolyticus TaxID=59839 RepID=A0ABT4GNP0_9BACL|nr:ABC transporter ATP-binding protein [Paenibacillus alginolyticus]MCY9665414.1 ABC transporter ATP-binding protein [Paenibacillus alginolyticus]MCY9697750.1 ABC transporter ATP-binding protein [Paenibacillus alginolyticus]MEC0147335.1 ABC transporter ATP-binding protein [Paenibacillus alginolyticus]
MNTILETAHLSKVYGNDRGIRDISIQLHEGDVYGLLGPNGAGKTTFLKLITGLIRPDKGTISLFNANLIEQFEQGMQHVGSMIESADFHDFLTAWQYLELVARFYPSVTPKRIEEVLDLVGLFKVRKEKIKGYSTGMKQKLALAAAILPEPKFVILDEPTNGLDIEGTVMFRKLIKQLSEEKGTSFLISSHMIHELEQLCNRVGIVVEGQLKKEGYVSELLQSNQSLEQFYIDELQLSKEDQDCA